MRDEPHARATQPHAMDKPAAGDHCGTCGRSLLLDHGADVGARDAHGCGAPALASGNGYTRPRSRCCCDAGRTPWPRATPAPAGPRLSIAAQDGHTRHTATAALLLDCTALMFAVDKGHTATAVLLLKRAADVGADVGATGDNGGTVLMRAVQSGHTAMVTLLLDRSADVGPKGNAGRTALVHAARKGHTTMASLLLDRGANLGAKDNAGVTALMHAMVEGRTATAVLLLDRGADLKAKDNVGVAALMHTAQSVHTATAALLLGRGADIGASGRAPPRGGRRSHTRHTRATTRRRPCSPSLAPKPRARSAAGTPFWPRCAAGSKSLLPSTSTATHGGPSSAAASPTTRPPLRSSWQQLGARHGSPRPLSLPLNQPRAWPNRLFYPHLHPTCMARGRRRRRTGLHPSQRAAAASRSELSLARLQGSG